jgi:hypothetical protein
MRKLGPIRIVAVLALAGSALAGVAITTASGVAGASKGPVSATCSGITGSGTVAAEIAGAPTNSIISGCSGGHSSPTGVSVSTLNSNETSGSATIFWLNKKTTTYQYTVATASATCPTFLGQAATGSETITLSNLGGTAKITAGGTFTACYYIGSDGTLYEATVGAVTI